MVQLNIIVIGAGIGGPCAAIGLARNGHNVTIYERANSTSSVGYAFRITPNSDLCLKHLGIDTEAGGAVSASSNRQYDPDGNVNFEFKENESKATGGEKKGVSVFASRPQLNAQLLEVAQQSGVKIITGKKVESVDVNSTSIVLEDGTSVSADLIIAADGVYSVVRQQILDGHDQKLTLSTGHNALRFMLPKSKVLEDDILFNVAGKEFRMFTWAGNDKRIIVYPVDFDRQYNVVCTYPQHLARNEVNNGDNAAAVAYDERISHEKVLEIFSDYEPAARRLLSLADPDGLRVWPLNDMDDMPRWSRNRTVLMGDAAHPVLPFGFSGASMSIEDGLTLSTLLPSGTKVEEISNRLRLYEDIRKPRVAKVRDTSRSIGQDNIEQAGMKQYMQFLASYDTIADTKQKLSTHLVN